MKKRLLFLNGHLDAGGVERSLVEILEHLDFDRHEVDLVLFERLGDYAPRLPRAVRLHFVDLTRLEGSFVSSLSAAVRRRDGFSAVMRVLIAMRRIVGGRALSPARRLLPLRSRYDCAIAFRPGVCAEILAHVVSADRKVVWWHHGEFNFHGAGEVALRETFEHVDQVVAVSRGCEEMLARRDLGLEGKLLVVPNMIDAARIRSSAMVGRDDRTRVFDPVRPVLVSVGRLSPEKAMIDCVEACRILVERGRDPRWLIVGDGEERPRLERAIAASGLEKNVLLLGKIADSCPTMARADVLVHPSRVESFALTVLEALALRIPSVVARSMGPCEYVRDERHALLVDPGPASLADGVGRVLDDDRLRLALAGDHSDLLDAYSPVRVMDRILRDVIRDPEARVAGARGAAG